MSQGSWSLPWVVLHAPAEGGPAFSWGPHWVTACAFSNLPIHHTPSPPSPSLAGLNSEDLSPSPALNLGCVGGPLLLSKPSFPLFLGPSSTAIKAIYPGPDQLGCWPLAEPGAVSRSVQAYSGFPDLIFCCVLLGPRRQASEDAAEFTPQVSTPTDLPPTFESCSCAKVKHNLIQESELESLLCCPQSLHPWLRTVCAMESFPRCGTLPLR